MPLVLHIQNEIIIELDLKQYRNSCLCSTRQVLPKILQIQGKTPTPQSCFITLFKKNPTAGAFQVNLMKPLKLPSI